MLTSSVRVLGTATYFSTNSLDKHVELHTCCTFNLQDARAIGHLNGEQLFDITVLGSSKGWVAIGTTTHNHAQFDNFNVQSTSTTTESISTATPRPQSGQVI